MAGGIAAEARTQCLMATVRPLFSTVRSHGGALLASVDDPASEMLALVWGPRFDREHAQGLARSVVAERAGIEYALAQAADSFDRLTPPRQQRLRQLIRRHAGGTITA